MMPISSDHEGLVLILAPRGRDAAVIEQVLAKSGTKAKICSDPAHWLSCLRSDADAALITEEALADVDNGALTAWLDAQPPWSDFPFILLATKQIGRRPEHAAAILERLGNVVVLERPINA